MMKCIRGFIMGLLAIPLFICLMVADAFLVQKDELDETKWYEQE